MAHARTLLAVPVLCLLPAGLSLATRYEPESAVRVVTETELELETTAFEMLVDGEPFDRAGTRGGFSMREARRIVAVDRRLAVEAGRPAVVRRSFESVAASLEVELGGSEQERDRESPLDGLTLELSRDGDEVAAEVVEGDPPAEDEALEGHRLELALDALLPPDPVEEGASWPLDARAVRRALGWDLERALFPRPERDELDFGDGGAGRRGPGRGPRGGESARLAQAEWDGTATLVAAAEASEHGQVARIRIELAAEGEVEEPGPGFGRDRAPRGPSPAAAPESTFEFELEGELLFSLEHRRPVHLEVEGELLFETTRESEREGRTFSLSSTREGTYRQVVTVTREDFEE